MLDKLEQIEQTFDELTARLADPDVFATRMWQATEF